MLLASRTPQKRPAEMQFAKAKTPCTLVKATRRRENGKKYRWGAKISKRAACMPKKHAFGGSHAKTSVEMRW